MLLLYYIAIQRRKCVYLSWAGPPEGVRRAGSPEGRVGGEADSWGLAARVGVGGARGAGVHRAGGTWEIGRLVFDNFDIDFKGC